MSRVHFEAIAKILATLRDTLPSKGRKASTETIDRVAYELSLAFEGFNDNFDGERFLRACHVALENVL